MVFWYTRDSCLMNQLSIYLASSSSAAPFELLFLINFIGAGASSWLICRASFSIRYCETFWNIGMGVVCYEDWRLIFRGGGPFSSSRMPPS